MADILVRKTSRPTHDAGDVFGVYPNGHIKDVSPDSVFCLIRCPEMSEKELKYLLESNIDEKGLVIDRRKVKFDVKLLSKSKTDALTSDHVCDITKAEVASIAITKVIAVEVK